MHLHGQKFSGALEKFSFTSSFFVKMQKATFLKKNGFRVKYFNKSKYEGDPEIRGKVLLNRVAFLDCNENLTNINCYSLEVV